MLSGGVNVNTTARRALSLSFVSLLLAGSILTLGEWPVRSVQANDAPAGDSRSCIGCHQGIESMHGEGDADIGVSCVGCHGGDGNAATAPRAHIHPSNRKAFGSKTPVQRSEERRVGKECA